MVELTESQEAARRLISSSRLSLLTGGGGTGKTTVLAEMLRSSPDISTVGMAPTGKAAMRMDEAFREAGAECVSRTIHSALIPTRNGHDSNGWSFARNSESPLPYDRIIVDESSMIDTNLMESLILAVPGDCQLVFVGDDYQLPPVGKGCPFRDMIESGVFPHANLTEVHRYAGRIAKVCNSVRKGSRIIPSVRLDMDPNAGEFGPENYRHIERRNPTEQIGVLESVMEKIQARGFCPFRDVQVIVTRNEQGPVSKAAVNSYLQDLLNKDGRTVSGCPFRVGDKVTCRKNGFRDTYDVSGSFAMQEGRQAYIPNGEDGVVVHIEDRSVFVKFFHGTVKFNRAGWGSEVVLGYAITCHSSQGSGWPVVIYMIDNCRLNDRSLVYTGLSRAKKILFTVGRISVLNNQIRTSQVKERKTFLREYLKGTMRI